MTGSKIKRVLWALNEFMTAPPRGISMQELSDKWAIAYMNDEKEPGIPERTFHRIRRTIEDTFGIKITCIRGAEPRYRLSNDDLEPGGNSLLSLFLNRIESQDDASKSLKDLLNLLLAGNDLTAEEMDAVKTIANNLRRIPYDYGKKLIFSVQEGEIKGADDVEWDEDYRGYVCVWNEEVYHKTKLWLSIGFYDDRVLFYVVTNNKTEEEREKMSHLLNLDNGELYRRGYWWYEPTDKSFFQLRFQTVPDMEEVKRRIEILLSRIASLP